VLIDKSNETDISCERIAGPKGACITVNSQPKAMTDVIYEPTTYWQSFIVSDLSPPIHPASGKLHLTTTKDSDITVDYGTRCGLQKPAVVDASKYSLSKSAVDQLWAWDDDGTRAFLALSERTKNVYLQRILTRAWNRPLWLEHLGSDY